MRSRVSDFQERAAPEVQQKDEAWYRGQLEPKCPDMMVRGKDFLIRCPFHPDNNPSCGVDRHTGVFKCFSCGAGGGWNKLAKQLGMEKLAWKGEKRKDVRIEKLTDEVARSLTKAGIVDPNQRRQEKSRPLVSPWPETEAWRGLSGAFLAGVGCIRVTDLKRNTLRIGLPVRTAHDELLGYTCRVIEPEDAEPKYAPLAADRVSWRAKELPANIALFLVDRAIDEGWDRLVLVEGPFDALRLYSMGVPALAILGTANWNEQKAATVIGLGLSVAVVMMDNDRSGHEAQARVLADLKGNVKAVGLRLPEGMKDPGSMTDAQVRWLKKKLGSL